MADESRRRTASRGATEPAVDPVGAVDPVDPTGAADATGGATAVEPVRRRRGAAARGASDRPPGMSPPWVPALMVTCFLLGLVWLVVYYLAGQRVPGMSAIGNWNLLVGIGMIALGFVVSTQWR